MYRFAGYLVTASALFGLISPTVTGRSLTLDEAIEIALNESGRGGIIRGNLEVAEQQYFAEKIGFYVPELSINGTLPSYSRSEDWEYLPVIDQYQVLRRPDLTFHSDITLKQNLITGGDLTASANLARIDREQPQYNGVPIDIKRRQGQFSFSLTQPVLQPSQPKYDLRNSKDDVELARLDQVESAAALRKEVIDAFFGVLTSDLTVAQGRYELQKAQLQAEIDSSKLVDGVVSQETNLASVSARLDAELQLFEYQDDATNQRRTLATLLDVSSLDELEPTAPEQVATVDSATVQQFLSNWGACIPLMKAQYAFDKEKRKADFTASSHGLTGMLTADYNFTRGQAQDAGTSSNLRTNSWELKFDVSYPIWDGGASGAAVKAARLSAEQARLEFAKTEKSVRAEIAALANKLSVSFRKLDVLKQKISIEQNKLDIARSRFDEGQISELTLLDEQVSFLEAKNEYFEELKTYFSTKVDLESKYLD